MQCVYGTRQGSRWRVSKLIFARVKRRPFPVWLRKASDRGLVSCKLMS